MTLLKSSLETKRESLAGTSIGNYALFAGGKGSGGALYSTVDAYDHDLVGTAPTPLVASRSGLGAASNQNYALFFGGAQGNSAVVDAYDKDLTRTNPVQFSTKSGVAVRAGNYVLAFSSNYAAEKAVAYDMFLTKTNVEISTAIDSDYYAGTTLRDFAVICGDRGDSWNTTISYDPYLVMTAVYGNAFPRMELAAASIGDYALFAGGRRTDESGYVGTDIVEVYRYI